jgi:hypothetical protein
MRSTERDAETSGSEALLAQWAPATQEKELASLARTQDRGHYVASRDWAFLSGIDELLLTMA